MKTNNYVIPTGYPAYDFAKAVSNELGSFREGEFYQFGPMLVRFYGSGDKFGADFYRKVRGTLTALYSVERVNTSNKRINKGYAELD